MPRGGRGRAGPFPARCVWGEAVAWGGGESVGTRLVPVWCPRKGAGVRRQQPRLGALSPVVGRAQTWAQWDTDFTVPSL